MFFLTGTDEHGIKMLQTAGREKITPRLAFFVAAADLRARFLVAFFAAFFLAIVFVRVATAFRPCLEFKPDWD